MASSSHSAAEQKAHLLRPEAQPVRFHALTADQQVGLRKLVDILGQSVARLSHDSHPYTDLRWLSHSNTSQLTFIDGRRGTGKTTLMLTLCRLLTDNSNWGFVDEQIQHGRQTAEEILSDARRLSQRVVILEPLDMEPLPKGTPILSAILARIRQAADQLGFSHRSGRGLLDDDPQDNPSYVRFRQLQAQVARALDGNLEARMGGLDREQFGMEVLNQEEDRLQLPSLLSKALQTLSASLARSDANPETVEQQLFLVPIDDVDLNPQRCLQLLRLLRHFSVPQLFFLLMGQRDLVESTVKLDISSDFQEVGDPEKSFSPVASRELCKELAEVAVANLQKQLTLIVDLPPIDLRSVLTFKPLVEDSPHADGLPTLGELFERIAVQFPPDSNEPSQDQHSASQHSQVEQSADEEGQTTSAEDEQQPLSLRSILTGDQEISSLPKQAKDFALGQYPGLGAFEVTARRLVDLWRWLMDVLHGYTIESPRLLDAEVLAVFERHWQRIVDEDPLIDNETRERLGRESISACEVAPRRSPPRVEQGASGIEVPIRDSSFSVESNNGPDVRYQAVLRVMSAGPGSGLPQVTLKNSDGVEIRHPRTCCGFVLLHDLRQWAHAQSTGEHPKPSLLGGTSPVSVRWSNNASEDEVIVWPLPPVPTYAAQSRFFELTRRELRFDVTDTKSGSSAPQLDPNVVESLIQTWIVQGTKLATRPFARASAPRNWQRLIEVLEHLAPVGALNDSSLREWAHRVVMLCMPEACGISVRVSMERTRSYSQWLTQNTRELQQHRQRQLGPLWSRHKQLWRHLNHWVDEPDTCHFLVADEPVDDSAEHVRDELKELRREFRDEIKDLREETRSDTQRLEDRMKRDSQLLLFTSLVRQAVAAKNSRLDTAGGFLAEVAELAKSLVANIGEDQGFASNLRRELEDAASRFEECRARDRALELREHAVHLARDNSERHPSSDAARRILASSLIDLGDACVEMEHPDEAEDHYREAFDICQSLAQTHEGDRQAKYDLGVAYNRLGNAHMLLDRLDEAAQAIEQSLEITRELSNAESDFLGSRLDLQTAHMLLSDVFLRLEMVEEAIEEASIAVDLGHELSNRQPDDAQVIRNINAAYNRLGAAQLAAGRRSEAYRAFLDPYELPHGSGSTLDDSRHRLETAIAFWGLSRTSASVRDRKQYADLARGLFRQERDRGTYFHLRAKEAEQDLPAEDPNTKGSARKASREKPKSSPLEFVAEPSSASYSSAKPGATAAKKRTAKKKATRRAPSSGAPAKKTSEKKTSAKKTSAKKTSAKKTSSKKTAAKKVGAKKTTAKKARRRK